MCVSCVEGLEGAISDVALTTGSDAVTAAFSVNIVSS